MTITVKSKQTGDCVKCVPTTKSACQFHVVIVDDIAENMKLVSIMLKKLTEKNIKTIYLPYNKNFIIPNSINDRCKKVVMVDNSEEIECDVQSFDIFYKENLKHLITGSTIIVPIQKDDKDGWHTVINLKNIKGEKRRKLKKEAESTNKAWREM